LSELRPTSPLQRPETARPRQAPELEVEPPSPDELLAIERHLVSLPTFEGGDLQEDTHLGVALVRGPGHEPDTSYAAMPRWGAADWRQRLEAVRDRMRADGAWPSLLWCVPLDRPIGLERELRGLGWAPVADETVLWVGHASVVPHLDPGLRIEAVQRRTLATHAALESRIFGIAWPRVEPRREALAAAMEAGRVRAWVVWHGDEPVAVARLSQAGGVAALQGIGVVEDRRGQGFGTLITTVATRAGLALGNRIVWLSVSETNPAARRLYARLGFAPAMTWTRWLVTEDPPRS
jgi:ribosomal protein S18 acetylase RimI-like enzyme